MEFQSLTLTEDLKKALFEAGYIDAMPVQQKVIELGLEGRDLYVQSQTGTGKTAAFLIIIFHRLMTKPELKGRKALIMVPTRELAVQVEEEAKVLGRYLPFKIGSFYGGVGYGEQQKLLRGDAQILVGTPGRILDLNSSGQMNLMDIAFLVLDEADRMFDMGFYPDLRKLIKVVSPAERRQTMLFSATLNVYVKNLALEYTNNPLEIEIEPEHITVEEIDQLLYHVPSEKKFALLLGIMQRENPESAIIFCNTKRYTEIISQRLKVNGIECEYISGDLPQKKRLALIDGLKSGKYHYLAATDVAARGLDVEGLALVVNFDLPAETENYVHRIGRTARAGANGKAISFASEQDVYELSDIEKYIGKKIPAEIARDTLYGDDQSRGRGGGRRDGRRRDERGPRVERGKERREYEGGKRQHSGKRAAEPQTAVHGKLNKMSFEERIAYFQEKYEKPAPAPRTEKPQTGTGGTGKKRRRRGRGGKPAAQPATAQSSQGKRPQTARPAPASQSSVPRQKEKSTVSSPQKNLFARIAAFFKKTN